MSEFYANIRRALGVSGQEVERLEAVKARLRERPRNLVPGSGGQSSEEQICQFSEILGTQQASVSRVAELALVSHEIAGYLERNDLLLRVRLGDDKLFDDIDWTQQRGVELVRGAPGVDDVVSLTHAFAGAAETGTLFVASGPDNPVTLSFLPEVNMILIRKQDIVWSYEEAWEKLPGRGAMPRTVNLISGPSRTADIEQTLITGAHGPRRLHVIIVG